MVLERPERRSGSDRPDRLRGLLAADLHDGSWGTDTLSGMVDTSRALMREGSVSLTEWNLLIELQVKLREELDVRREERGPRR